MLGTLNKVVRGFLLVMVVGWFTFACGSSASKNESDAIIAPDVLTAETPDVAICPDDYVGDKCVPCLGRTGDGGVCSNHGECFAGPDGQALCQCEEGYEGGACSEDIDECILSTNSCSPDALCTNTWGGYSCTCNAGYEGDGQTCTDIDDCATAPCGDHGTCTDGLESFDCLCDDNYEGTLCQTPKKLLFAVYADTPYNSEQELALEGHISQMNQADTSHFVIHLGDIKGGFKAETQSNPCTEDRYIKVANIFHESAAPVFFIPGDNEWNDCEDPDQAWALWWTHLHQFETFWPDAPVVERQPERQENFAWVSRKVLLIGINLVGGKKIDPDAWDLRLAQNAEWVANQLDGKKGAVAAAIIFGHAAPSNTKSSAFFDAFRLSAQAFEKPVLYMNGDLHTWVVDKPFPADAPNVTQVQLKGGSAPAVQVTVDHSMSEVFDFDQNPFE